MQRSLLDPPLAATRDPVTSKMAAESVREKAARQCEAVLALIRRWPDCTGHELAGKPGALDYYVIMRRVSTLRHAGFIEWAGIRACSVSGNACQTYRSAARG